MGSREESTWRWIDILRVFGHLRTQLQDQQVNVN